MEEKYLYKELTSEIIAAFYIVYNELGFGFLEKVYENALVHELRKRGFDAEQQKPIQVIYNGVKVGEYFADILVNDLVILELKAAEGLCHENELQLLNYLKATEKEIGLLLNFGAKPEIKRKIFTNDKKKIAH